MRDIKDPEVRRNEIMEAAMRLFTAKGYLNTTTQDIINEVNISRGLLYYHFKNKEDVLYCIVEKYSDPILRKLKNITYSKDKNALEKMKLFIEATIISPNKVTNNETVLQEVMNIEENRYLMDRFSHKLCDCVIDNFTTIIEQGNDEGFFDVTYPKDTATFLMTGYIFVSNDIKITCNIEDLNRYLESFKMILERSLGVKNNIFNIKRYEQ